MKGILKDRMSNLTQVEQRLSFTREFLQHMILAICDRREIFKHWAFVGGTALRVIYNLRRFSEDLDFSRLYEASKLLTVEEAAKSILKDLTAWGFKGEIGKVKGDSMQSCFIRFPGLLAEFGISADKRQKLSIKIETDMNPPQGYVAESTPIQKEQFINIVHHDLPSLFAGKLHAILFRGFIKGRDFYDLMWFLTKDVPVNTVQLENAIMQTKGTAEKFNTDSLRGMLKNRIKQISFSDVTRDLSPFIEDPMELKIINKDALLKATDKLHIV